MKKLQKSRGFTLIELMVIFGIIVIVSTIILVNLSQTRNRASDTAAMKYLNDLQTYSNEYYIDKNGDFSSFCLDNQTLLNRAGDDNNRGCSNSANKWCAYADLKASSGRAYCVDSNMKKGQFSKNAILSYCEDQDYASCPSSNI